MAYTLATAAEAAKVTKPTVFRWIKSGKISATRAEDNTFRIEPAELHRYLDSIAKETLQRQAGQQPDTAADAPPETPEAIALRYEVEKLKALLAAMNVRVEEVCRDRDAWRVQAERLAISGPAVSETRPVTTPRIRPAPRGWWPWRRAG